MKTFCHVVGIVNERVARIISFLVYPLIGFTCFEVVARYFFNRPTIWVWDLNCMILGLLTTLGAGYTLLIGGHVEVDVFVSLLSPKKRAIINLITSPLFFFIIGAMAWQSGKESWYSVLQKESTSSLLSSPIYPLKVLMTVGICLLLFQGIVKFIHDLDTIIGGGGKWTG